MILAAYVDGLGLLGPGFANWPEGAAILKGANAYRPGPTQLPVPLLLPAAERRRAGRGVKLALAVSLEATSAAGANPASLASVFASSGGDGHNCHALCEALAQPTREVSPTRFANSVHNAAAGYWSIGTGATAACNVMCAFDASFGAGLIEALAQVEPERRPVLLAAYDTEYPEPLHAKRPIPDAFGAAFVLAPERSAHTLARIETTLRPGGFERMSDAALEALRVSIPAARALPLLERLARGGGFASIEYLDGLSLDARVLP